MNGGFWQLPGRRSPVRCVWCGGAVGRPEYDAEVVEVAQGWVFVCSRCSVWLSEPGDYRAFRAWWRSFRLLDGVEQGGFRLAAKKGCGGRYNGRT